MKYALAVRIRNIFRQFDFRNSWVILIVAAIEATKGEYPRVSYSENAFIVGSR
jgi:hypothetical protein